MNQTIVQKHVNNYTVSIVKNGLYALYGYSLFVGYSNGENTQEVVVGEHEDETVIYAKDNLPQDVISVCHFMADVMRLIVIAERWGNGFPITSPTITKRFSRNVRSFVIQNRLLTVTLR